MKQEAYPIKEQQQLIYTFNSVGRNGIIRKVVRYDPLDSLFFNLGFGDRIKNTLDFSDDSNSNNGDIRKVMATVVQTLPLFFHNYPNKIVYFRGSDERRTLFYCRIVKMYYDDLKDTFHIQGSTKEGRIEDFKPDGVYISLTIKKIKK